jgi:hypothetical protein
MLQKPLRVIKNLLGVSPQPTDERSRRFVAMIECALNQNARDTGAACFPDMNFPLLELCHRYGVGILQMPCPEVAALGPGRKRPPGQSLRAAMDSEAGRSTCRALAREVSDTIDAYAARGCELVAVLGGNPLSPGCAVHQGEDGLRAESGVFMQALQTELRRRKYDPAFRGMRDYDPEQLREDLAWLQERLEALASRK